jgi:hypothetical protein
MIFDFIVEGGLERCQLVKNYTALMEIIDLEFRSYGMTGINEIEMELVIAQYIGCVQVAMRPNPI